MNITDGTVRECRLFITKLKVRIKGGRVVLSDFLILSDVSNNETLLDNDFIMAAGISLDFSSATWQYLVNDAAFRLEFKSHFFPCILLYCRRSSWRWGRYSRLRGETVPCCSFTGKRWYFGASEVPTTIAEHYIDTGDHLPISCPPYCVTPAKKEVMKVEYQDGNLLLVTTGQLSSSSESKTRKFMPKRDGPHKVSRKISPTSYEIADCNSSARQFSRV